MKRSAPLKRKTPLKRSTQPIKRSSKPIAKGKAIKQQTPKEKKVKDKLSILKREIELEAVQNNKYYCAGCGRSYPGLDKSHILSVSLYKQYELLKENIQLMCRHGSPHATHNLGCHQVWESGSIEQKMKLLCFEKNMTLIKRLDESKYLLLNNEINNLTDNLNINL